MLIRKGAGVSETWLWRDLNKLMDLVCWRRYFTRGRPIETIDCKIEKLGSNLDFRQCWTGCRPAQPGADGLSQLRPGQLFWNEESHFWGENAYAPSRRRQARPPGLSSTGTPFRRRVHFFSIANHDFVPSVLEALQARLPPDDHFAGHMAEIVAPRGLPGRAVRVPALDQLVRMLSDGLERPWRRAQIVFCGGAEPDAVASASLEAFVANYPMAAKCESGPPRKVRGATNG
jgi:hypothetical protein